MKNHKMRISLLMMLAVCIVNCNPLYAQREKTKHVTAEGSYVASKYETQAFGQGQALWNAKENALKEAGVLENITSVIIVGIDNTSIEYQEIHSEMGMLELEGRLRNVRQLDSKIEPTATQQNIVYSTTITADVIVEEVDEDRHFQLETKGFNGSYFSGEKMNFTITPTKDCYIRIFYFGEYEEDNIQLYPIRGILKDTQFKAGIPAQFPPEDPQLLYETVFEYSMEMSKLLSNDKNMERGEILIVALKDDTPFTSTNGKVTKQDVFKWLSQFKRDEKRIMMQIVHIIKR